MTKTPPSAVRCAICGKPVLDPAYRPFCCKRCADVDLQRWLSGRYVVSAEAGAEGGEAPPDGDEEG